MPSNPTDSSGLSRRSGSRDLLAALTSGAHDEAEEARHGLDGSSTIPPLDLSKISNTSQTSESPKSPEEDEALARQGARGIIAASRPLTEYHFAMQSALNQLAHSALTIKGGVASLDEGSVAGGFDCAATVAGIVPVVGQFIDLFLSGASGIAGARHTAALKEKFEIFQSNILPTLNTRKWNDFVEDLATVMTIAKQEEILEASTQTEESRDGVLSKLVSLFKSSDSPRPAYRHEAVAALALKDSAELSNQMFSREFAKTLPFGGIESADPVSVIKALDPDHMEKFQDNLFTELERQKEMADSLPPSPTMSPRSVFQAFGPQKEAHDR